MKIIFLDIDGVLNCEKTFQRFRGVYAIDPAIVSIFKKIIKETDAKVVLSSTWRRSEESRKEVRKQVMDFIDVTPSMPLQGGAEMMERGYEIQTWLEDNKHLGIEKYAILDDDSDFLPDQPLFKTTWKEGLTEEIAKDVIDYLK